MTTGSPLVGIIMGSDSDLSVMSETAKALEEFGVPFEISVLSAHRSPRLVTEYAVSARERGLQVLICGAGRAAHLAGVVGARNAAILAVQILSLSDERLADALTRFKRTLEEGVETRNKRLREVGWRNDATT